MVLTCMLSDEYSAWVTTSGCTLPRLWFSGELSSRRKVSYLPEAADVAFDVAGDTLVCVVSVVLSMNYGRNAGTEVWRWLPD